MFRRAFLTSATAAVWLATAASGASADDAAPSTSSTAVRGVVELFTSQGCSSCPRADRLFAAMSQDKGIVALAYHVDYWDYIGWVDPHGARTNTQRQRAYADTLGNGSIYTPQVVVNGRTDAIGSRVAEIEGAIAETDLTKSATGASVALQIRGDRLHIQAKGVEPGKSSPVLMLVTYDKESSTEVTSGENAGQTLVDSHAVRDWRILGMWDGKPLEVDIPLAMLKREDGTRSGCAAILQTVTDTGGPGPILAAAAIEF